MPQRLAATSVPRKNWARRVEIVTALKRDVISLVASAAISSPTQKLGPVVETLSAQVSSFDLSNQIQQVT
jgi:hypothetical protein